MHVLINDYGSCVMLFVWLFVGQGVSSGLPGLTSSKELFMYHVCNLFVQSA